jgi:hypothetical protein
VKRGNNNFDAKGFSTWWKPEKLEANENLQLIAQRLLRKKSFKL